MHPASMRFASRSLAAIGLAGSLASGVFSLSSATIAVSLMTPAIAEAQQARPATAQAAPAAPARRSRSETSALGGLGGDSKEPIKIDADKLDVLDKENKAVFSGNVVAVQGDTTVRCTMMTVFYEGRAGQVGGAGAARAAPTPAAAAAPATGAAPASAAAAAPGQSNDSSIKRIECKGPVTVVSKTQAATSDNAVFDRANNQVIMTGNVALNDGPNITRGERLVYNTTTGIANVQGGRVQGFFVPNAETAKPGATPPKPASPTN